MAALTDLAGVAPMRDRICELWYLVALPIRARPFASSQADETGNAERTYSPIVQVIDNTRLDKKQT